jgi:uroporphyrinogen decarboxylase-like protein
VIPRERIQGAFEHRPTERVPVHHIGISSRVASAVLGREAFVGGGIQQWREAAALWEGEEAHQEFLERSFRDAIDLALALDQDIVRPEYWRMARKPAQRLNEYTFVYGSDDNWLVMRFDPVTELYQEADRSSSAEMSLEELERQVEASEKPIESYRPIEGTFAAALRAQALVGSERVVRVGAVGLEIPRDPIWLEAVLARPDLVARHLDVQAERAVRNVAFLAERGFRHFWGGGDLASNRGPFYSPRALHELMLPRLRRISDACHRQGGYHLFASDGNLWPVADDLFGASGVDGFYEIDRRAGMDLATLRERFPRLTLLGNVSSHTLHRGTPEDVAVETLSCLEEARRRGGIVVGCSNQIVSETPLRNFLTMIELIAQHR